MSEIKCEVIEDLITLYVDNLSSDESNNIIEEHLEKCTQCKTFLGMLKIDEIKIDIVDKNNEAVDKVEKDLIDNIKRSIVNKNLVFALIGAIIAVGFTLDMFIFNAIILLPTIGAIVYLVTQKLWIAPLTVGIVKGILEFIITFKNITSLDSISIFDIFKYSITIGLIFSLVTTIGVVIGVLIKGIFLENNY